MKLSHVVLMAAATVALAGCNRSNTLPDESAGTVSDGGFGSDSSNTSGVGNGSTIGVSALDEQTRQLMQQLVVYFDYDQADIKPEFNALLAAHGRYLSQNPMTNLRLEGHADERGSREYNIGLGERRAQAVRRVLMLQGAQASQITTVSYGEERPAQTGSDEESWRLNRRVELVYR